MASGLAALAGLVVGLLTLSGRRAAVAGGLLLATNYAFVMWNRAALMESTVAAWLVLAWAAYALADRRPGWGLVAGAAAVAAWFTKASAAFFLAALVLDVAIRLLRARQHTRADEATTRTRAEARTGRYVLAGLALAAGAVVAFFVLPHWSEYRFYNWQMSVTRKPAYSIGALVDRASWLPIVEGLLSRMWIELVIGSVALVTIGLRWRTARPAERLLVLWVVIGLAELVAHDSGNERRYVVFIPAFIALASLVIGAAGPLLPESFAPPRGLPARVWSLGLILVLGYLIAGSLLRPLLRAEIEAGHLSRAVRLGAGLAAVLTLAAAWRWSALVSFARGRRLPALAGTLCVAAAVGWNAVEFTAWARRRTQENYEASVELGRLLPAGDARAGQAGQRPGAREPYPAALRRATTSATTRTASTATTCAIY